MVEVNQLRKRTTFELDGQLYKVLDYEHNKTGRGGATIRVTVFNIRTGSRTELTFNSGVRVQDISLEKRMYQYLYQDAEFFVFMDLEHYTQKMVPVPLFGDDAGYLKDNIEVALLDYNEEILDYDLPTTVDMVVIDSEMAVAGNTATGATKNVILETGLKVRTPLFVEVGDTLRINTETGSYVTRV